MSISGWERNTLLKGLSGRAASFIFAAPLSIAFIAMFVFFSVHGKGFFSAGNLENVALQSAVLCIISVAVGLVMISGYIDLSVGSVMGFERRCRRLPDDRRPNGARSGPQFLVWP